MLVGKCCTNVTTETYLYQKFKYASSGPIPQVKEICINQRLVQRIKKSKIDQRICLRQVVSKEV